MGPDRSLDCVLKLVANFQVFAVFPAANVLRLKLTVQFCGKSVVLARIADKTGRELDGMRVERFYVGYQSVRNACTVKENIRNSTFRKKQSVDADCRGAKVFDCFKTRHSAEISFSNGGVAHGSADDGCLVKIGPT